MNILTKVIATSAVATLLLPTLALAHGIGVGVKGDNSLQVRIEKGIVRAENKDSRDQNKEDRQVKHATTTAAAITKQAVRIQTAADTMASFNDRIGALIAGADATVKADLETKFAAVKTAEANAKVQAGNAITGAAQVNASNSTTTNATLLAAAKVDLREAKGFLHEAQKALFSILRIFWR